MKNKIKRKIFFSSLIAASILSTAAAMSCGAPQEEKKPTNPKDGNKDGGIVDLPPTIGGPGEGGDSPRTYGSIDPVQSKLVGSWADYTKLSIAKRYEVDNKAYLNGLKSQYDIDPKQEFVPSDIKNGFGTVQAYDDKATKLGLPDFVTSYLKGFTTYSGSGLEISPNVSGPALGFWNSEQSGFDGRSRFLPNDLYKNTALQTYSISYVNEVKGDYVNEVKGDIEGTGKNTLKSNKGTAWILDYVKPTDSSYPTKWYIATNIHVIGDLTFTKSQTESFGSDFTSIYDEEREKPLIKEARKVKAQIDELQNEYNEVYRKLQTKEHENDQALKARADQLNFELAPPLQNKLKDLNAQISGLTKNVTLAILDSDVPLQTSLNTVSADSRMKFVTLPASAVNIVYTANDFLKTSPKDYLDATSTHNKDYLNNQEMADFAVLEIDFSKVTGGFKYTKNSVGDKPAKEMTVNSAQELARVMTNAYASTENQDKQIKFAKNSLFYQYKDLTNEKVTVTNDANKQKLQVSRIVANFVSLGYPIAKDDLGDLRAEFPAKYADREGILLAENDNSLWTNKPQKGRNFYQEFGNRLNRSMILRNFLQYPGIYDLFITNPVINKGVGFNIKQIKDKTSSYQQGNYLNYGLAYSLESWRPAPGASGSSLRDLNNIVLGINFAIRAGAGSGTSLIQAFRSEGANYGGVYGSYNLPQYDLIYGGGKDQRTSYREALAKILKNGETTNLFTSGVNVIPEEYKFRTNALINFTNSSNPEEAGLITNTGGGAQALTDQNKKYGSTITNPVVLPEGTS